LAPCLHRIVEIGISLPIPTPKRVQRSPEIGQGIARHGLRIKDDELVCIGPLIVAGMSGIAVADSVKILLAAMECDMNPARLPGGAGGRHVDIPGLGHAVGAGGLRKGELALIERNQLARKLALVLGVERAINLLKKNPGLIIIAFVDEVILVIGAGETIIHGHLGMARPIVF
jgi:hypothetical protein